MTQTAETVVVDRPINVVYDQWTQFESFPAFMEGVSSVQQLDDTHLHWQAKIGGVEREWDAEITSQSRNRLVAWRATEGATNQGMVSFRELDPIHTEVALELDFEPEGVIENVGDKLGIVQKRATNDLRRFKEFIEAQPAPTGGWHGEVRGGDVTEPD